MATGDNRKTADAVARELAIDEVRAELNPKDKNEIIKRVFFFVCHATNCLRGR